MCGSAIVERNAVPTYYVGESEDILSRFATHRSGRTAKQRKREGRSWFTDVPRMFVLSSNCRWSKSRRRYIEYRFLKAAESLGLPLLNEPSSSPYSPFKGSEIGSLDGEKQIIREALEKLSSQLMCRWLSPAEVRVLNAWLRQQEPAA